MSQRVRVEDAAREIGCCVEYLRRKIQSGEWDLGEYGKPKKGQKKGSYFIFRHKLDNFLGIIGNEEIQENRKMVNTASTHI